MSRAPGNELLAARLAAAKEKRERREPTVPSTLAEAPSSTLFLMT